MSNGVGVIVRGHKTAIGFEKTPILPHRVSNRPITLPPHTVSRQFHLIESPGRPLNNAISHLLHSIVRSATQDMVTKTMLTTFTYLTTVLRHSNTIIKSREETISNVMTQKYRPTIEYTATVKAEPSSLPPEMLASLTGSSSYFENTLTTTYVYYNTFTVDSLPVILSSRETVTNVVTLPIYMSPTMVDLLATGSRVFETETYFTTYTFSKTLLPDGPSEVEKVVTTKEIITQVVVTEALVPPKSGQEPMATPLPPLLSADEITKTYLTTFTHLFTEIDDEGQTVVRSSTSVASEIVTETLKPISKETMEPALPASIFKIKLTAQPTFSGWITTKSLMTPVPGHITMRSPATLLSTMIPGQMEEQITFTTIHPTETVDTLPKTLEPVMIYATKTYYTTYTYFTTVLGDGSKTKATIHSRTHVVSKVVTEALSTSFDAYYLNALKSSYLLKHSTMIDITSSVREIHPANTLEATERPGTLITQSVSLPHWPKDHDELAVEVDGTTMNSIEGVEVVGGHPDKDNPVQAEIQVSSASSEEHFDEMKEEINQIVNVLTLAGGSEESPTSELQPSPSQEPVYSTAQVLVGGSNLLILKATPSAAFNNHHGDVEEVTLRDPPAYTLEEDDITENNIFSGTDQPLSHIPTPPLHFSSAPVQQPSTSKPKTKKPFNPYVISTDLNMFPEIGSSQSVIVDMPHDLHEYSDEDFTGHHKDNDELIYSSMLFGDRFQHSTSVLAKRTGTILFDPVTPSFKPPSDQILNLVSQIADDHHWADEDKDSKEEESDIPSPNVYHIASTFDSFEIPTSLVPVSMKSPTISSPMASKVVKQNSSESTGLEDVGDMPIHTLIEDDDFFDGSGSGAHEVVEEVTVHDSGVVDLETDHREDDHTTIPDEPEEEEKDVPEGFKKTTESPVPAFPPRTRYTTSQRPDKKKKKTQKPYFDAELTSQEEDSGETATKVYSLKIPNFDILAGGGDSVSDESENNSDPKKDQNSEQEHDDVSSESVERPQDDVAGFDGPGPSKSSISFPALGPGIIPAPGAGPVASSTSGIDWKPLLKLGAIGLGGLGASSLTKLAPWFNTMAGSFMKGGLLPLARNDTSTSYSSIKTGSSRPIFYKHPPPDGPLVQQHSEPVYFPVGSLDEDDIRHSDERIPRKPITSHAKEPSVRPVSLERDHYPPGRGHGPQFEFGPDSNFPPKHNFNFQPPNDHLPNIYTQMNDLNNLHKNGEYNIINGDPNLRVINGVPLDTSQSPSDLPVEGKTEFILRPIQNIFNGKPMFDSPKPGPMIPLRPPNNRPYQSGEITKVQRPVYNRPLPTPDFTDAMNDIPDSSLGFDHAPSRKPVIPDIPLMRPIPPTDGIILPHRVRDHNGGPMNNQRHPPNPDILHAFKQQRPFIPPPPRPTQTSKEDWPKPLSPFRGSGEIMHSPDKGYQDILHMRPPGIEASPGGGFHEGQDKPLFPPWGPQETTPGFGYSSTRPTGHPPVIQGHSNLEAEASEEDNVFKNVFRVRPTHSTNYDDRKTQGSPEISFHPHNAGAGPFHPIPSGEDVNPFNFEFNNNGFGHTPPQPVPTGIAGQPSDQFGQNQDDMSHEESAENPFQQPAASPSSPPSSSTGGIRGGTNNQQQQHRKPSWHPLDSNAPMSYSYFEDMSHGSQHGGEVRHPIENEIPPSPSSHTPPTHNVQHMPAAPPLAFPPTKHIPPHRQRPSTVYIVQQEEMDPPTTTTTPPPAYTPAASEHQTHSAGHDDDFDDDRAFDRGTTKYPKLIIKEVPTRPVAPYYRRPTTTPSPAVQQTPTNRATIAKLFIRRFSTTTTPPTTMYADDGGGLDTSPPRFVTWQSRPRPFSTSTTPRPTTTTPEPPPAFNNNGSTNTLIDSWMISPTVNDLNDLLDDFKKKYTPPETAGPSLATTRRPPLRSNVILPQRLPSPSPTTTESPLDDDLDSEYDDDDNLTDEEDELSMASSSERNATNGGHHPNHHPVHKAPINVDHFFSTGQGDFAQYYSGTEDRDTIIDPVNQKVIKSPYDDHRRNVSNIINKFRATTSGTTVRPRPIHFRNYSTSSGDEVVEGLTISLPNGAFGDKLPVENEISELPGPTTYRPRFDVTFSNKMGTTSEEPNAPHPTTFRGDVMRPTTFRPGAEDIPVGNRVRPDPTSDIIKARPTDSTRLKAPQAGMASFYDDEDSLSELKMKNKEIHKLPSFIRRPNLSNAVTPADDVLDAVADEDVASSEKTRVSVTPKASTEKSAGSSNETKKGEEYNLEDEGEYSEEYDSTYDEDGYLEVPPAGFSPAVQSGLKNSAEGKQNNQYVPNGQSLHHPTPQPQSRRPGPLEMLSNFFRRPPVRQPTPGGGLGRIPFSPVREPTRTMMPPPLNSNERPALEYNANGFNPNVKTIPLNPNSDRNGSKVDDPIVLLPKGDIRNSSGVVGVTTPRPKGESGERTTVLPSPENGIDKEKDDQDPLTSDPAAVTVNPNSNGHRESTYVEDSEYYEDDELEEDDKNNVIPPEEGGGDRGGPNLTMPPIKFEPTPAPPPINGGRPISNLNVGGHLVNGGPFFRPQQPRPPPIPGRRPLPPFLRLPPPPGVPPISNILRNPPPNPPPVPHTNANMPFPPAITEEEPQPPRTEMEPPPIDSNRLKAPILELPSSGPIRYRPLNNVHRPNLLRPDDELFKPTTKASKTVHTIASVDDLNKIVATNTFTAIIPTRNGEESSDTPEVVDATRPVPSGSRVEPTGVHLEGSESSVIVPSKSTGASVRMTSVVKYTGGRLETSEIEVEATTLENTISTIPVRRTNIIIPTRASGIQTTSLSSSTSATLPRRPPPFISRQTTTDSPSAGTSSTTANNTSSSVRVTVTMESSVSSSETSDEQQPHGRRPFIPTRAPPRNTNYPWLKRPTTSGEKSVESTTTTTEKTTTTAPRLRGPHISTQEPKEAFSTTLRFSPSIFNISRSNTRPDVLRRTTTVMPPRMSAPPTVNLEAASKSSSGESKERPSLIFPRPTTFKPPFRRPAFNFGSSSKSQERFTTTLINKVTTSGTPSPTTRNPSVFSGVLNNNNATTSSSNTTAGGESSEYEEYTDEEYEDEEDIELDGETGGVTTKKPNVTVPIITRTQFISKNDTASPSTNNNRVTSTSSSMSVSTSMSIGNNETKVITTSSSEISPTRVSNRGNKQKGVLNTMVLRGGGGGSTRTTSEIPMTTRYITHSESETKTLTETETTVVVTAGTPYTHTIMITKTVPPQTLISTIVGSVTLVNSIDVRPTTVRSTIFAEPTKEVYSFVDTSESNDEEADSKLTTERVNISGILTVGNFPRPSPRPPVVVPPPKDVVTTTKEPKIIRNRPVSIDGGCSANCTNSGHQACRPYANGTKYKCECKPGYARLKRKFPCRPTYTYELTLAINHMDGMSFDFKDLQNSATNGYLNFISVSKEAIDKAFLSTDIKRQFQGVEIMKLNPMNAATDKTIKTAEPKVYVDFLVQLTANVTEDRIRNHLIRTLKSSNFSVGRTGITSTKNMTDFGARDFNECLYSEFNDCSPNSDCINIRGSFSCRCKAGFRDKSPKKHKPGRDCFEMMGCPECNYKGHCRINAYGESFCECFRWFGGSKCHINLKILLFAIMGVVAILFIFVLLCSVLVCRRTKIRRERPGSGRFMRYRSPTSQATLDRAAIMNDSASSDGRQSPPRGVGINTSFTPDSLLVEGDPKSSGFRQGDSLMGVAPDNVHLMNFSLRNVIMDQDRSLTVVIPRAKIRPPSRPPSIHATLGPDVNADLAASERKLINYLDHSPYPPAPYPVPRPPPPGANSRQSTIKRHDSRQFRKLSLQEQRKISTGALVSSGTEVSARGGMRRRSIGPEPEPTYSGYEKSFSDLRSITDTMRSPAQQQLFSTDTSRTSCYSHSCKPPSYCAYSESVGHTMGDRDGASTVYTTQGKLFRMAPDDTSSTASSQ